MTLSRRWPFVFLALLTPFGGQRNLVSARICVTETFKVRSISGFVLDESGHAIPNAQVEVSKNKTDSIRQTLTDSNGSFSLPDFPAGKYDLRIRAIGFQDGWIPIVLSPPKKVSSGEKSLRIVLTLGMGCTSASLIKR
jgi:hypothetical protein